MDSLKIAVDMDDTIHDTQNKKPGYKLGQPVAGAAESLRYLKEQGAIIIIHSVWASTEQKCQAIAEWCRYFGIPYDFITNKKPDADIFIDNKGYRFENWVDTLKFIRTLQEN